MLGWRQSLALSLQRPAASHCLCPASEPFALVLVILYGWPGVLLKQSFLSRHRLPFLPTWMNLVKKKIDHDCSGMRTSCRQRQWPHMACRLEATVLLLLTTAMATAAGFESSSSHMAEQCPCKCCPGRRQPTSRQPREKQ